MNKAIYSMLQEVKGVPILVNGIGSQDYQCHIERKEGYHLHQLIIGVHGKGLLRVKGKEQVIGEGDIIYLKPGEAHEYFKKSDTWGTDWILFSGDGVEGILESFGIIESNVIKGALNSTIRRLFEELYIEMEGKGELKIFKASHLFYGLLIEIHRGLLQEKKSTNKEDVKIMEFILEYIEEHFREDICVEELARKLRYSPQHLCRVFKRNMGMRAFDYIARRRIQEAKQLLRSSKLSIKETGIAVGYRDSSYFSAVFKKYEGVRPSDFN